MDLSSRMEYLLSLAEQMGMEVRAEPMGGEGGGLCKLRGQYVLFVDIAADLASRYDRTCSALATLPGLDEHYLLPEIRADLDRARARSET